MPIKLRKKPAAVLTPAQRKFPKLPYALRNLPIATIQKHAAALFPPPSTGKPYPKDYADWYVFDKGQGGALYYAGIHILAHAHDVASIARELLPHLIGRMQLEPHGPDVKFKDHGAYFTCSVLALLRAYREHYSTEPAVFDPEVIKAELLELLGFQKFKALIKRNS